MTEMMWHKEWQRACSERDEARAELSETLDMYWQSCRLIDEVCEMLPGEYTGSSLQRIKRFVQDNL